MKKITYMLIGIGLLVQMSSCKEDFLDRQPMNQYGEGAVWSDLAMM
jgi:hypothetical protein